MPVITERTKRGGILPPLLPGSGGNAGGHGSSGSTFPISKGQIGLWVLLAAIIMLFGGISSAYIVLRGVPGWQNVQVPTILWLNTAILLASSATIEAARRSLAHSRLRAMKSWLITSGGFGLAFLVGQLLAWRQLVASGVYLPSTLHSSFLYVMTGLHGVHLIGGIAAMTYVLVHALNNRINPARDESLKLCATYWHFMDGLWLYLFTLLVLA